MRSTLSAALRARSTPIDSTASSLARRPAVSIRFEERISVCDRALDRRTCIAARNEFVSFLRKIESRFQTGDDLQQRLTNGGRFPAQGALEIRERQLRLQRRAGVDEIGDRLRLH